MMASAQHSNCANSPLASGRPEDQLDVQAVEDSHRGWITGAGVGFQTSVFLPALGQVVVLRRGLLPQFFGIGRLRSSQRAGWRSVPAGQAVEEGAEAFHGRSVPWAELRPDS